MIQNGFKSINQKSTECVDGRWKLQVEIIACESKTKNKGYGRK